MFEYNNGFRKTAYWSKEKMEKHALKYSMGYRAKKGYTFWEKDFDAMGFKTMIRHLISKWGIMSTELQNAYVKDMGVIKEDNKVEYIDNQEEETQEEQVDENGEVKEEQETKEQDFKGDF